jgi:hypothetical protein
MGALGQELTQSIFGARSSVGRCDTHDIEAVLTRRRLKRGFDLARIT